MSLETTTTAPKLEDFTPLSEHQEQTPSAFYGAKPVLHLRRPDAAVTVSDLDFASQPALRGLAPGVSVADCEPIEMTGLDIWVTFQNLTLFAPEINYGVHIKYQTIGVHAADGDEVLISLNLVDQDAPDEDIVPIMLRLTPRHSDMHPVNSGADGEEAKNPDLALFNAIAACQELNPDPPEEGEEGGFDETAPGATGWITSENMADFMDENGEFKMPEGAAVIGAEDEEDANGVNGLGEGAGRTRTAAEVDGDDGGQDEAKWQRTG